MFEAATFLGSLPPEGRVRVKIADVELASLATGTDAEWAGIVTGVQTENSKDQFGRSYSENLSLTVPISSFTDGFPPDNGLISIAYGSENTWTEYRAYGSRRRGNTMLSITLGPRNG